MGNIFTKIFNRQAAVVEEPAYINDVAKTKYWQKLNQGKGGSNCCDWYRFTGNSNRFEKGKKYLLKRDNGYEVMAYRISRILDIPHAKYFAATNSNDSYAPSRARYCLSEDILGPNEKLYQLREFPGMENCYSSDFKEILARFKQVFAEQGRAIDYNAFEKAIVIEAMKSSLLLNNDFTARNINIIKNEKTGELKLPPGMDYGFSLLTQAGDGEDCIVSLRTDKPWGKTPKQRAELEREYFIQQMHIKDEKGEKQELMKGIAKIYPDYFREFADKVNKNLNPEIIDKCLEGFVTWYDEKERAESVLVLNEQIGYLNTINKELSLGRKV